MKSKTILALAVLLLTPLAALHAVEAAKPTSRPNVVLIVADDLGYGDTGCYGATKIKTPRIDRLASEGLRFTDAHSICAVCNPSRYAILSGTYFFRARLTGGYALYFHDGQVTLPSLLKSAGYRTQALGKWHNGFGRTAGEPDWNQDLKPGPLEIGFDHFFGTPKTHNEPPLVFVEDHRVVGLDPADPIKVDHDLKYGMHGKMVGGAKAQAARPDERIDFIMAERAAAFFAKQTKDNPFFLYLAFAAPHTPVNPAPEFRGKSSAGLYGDYIQQLDHCTGLVLDALEKNGLAGNTLVIFTSDNGAVLTPDALNAGHRANRELLGQKTDIWEGGHRVPCIARWPGRVPAGSVREKLFSQLDFMATIAAAAGIPLPAGASPDGVSELAAFTDPAHAPAARTEALFLGTAKGAFNGGSYAFRQGDWLYLSQQGSGGMTVPPQKPKPWGVAYSKLGLINSDVEDNGEIKAGASQAQLYNLATDVRERTNVITQNPELAKKLDERLKQLIPKKKPVKKPAATQ